MYILQVVVIFYNSSTKITSTILAAVIHYMDCLTQNNSALTSKGKTVKHAVIRHMLDLRLPPFCEFR